MARTKTTRQRRRTRGEGTLYEKTRTWKTADGKTRSKTYWVAMVSEGYVSENGRRQRQRPTFYGETAAEARAMRDRYLAEVGKEAPQEQEDSTSLEQYALRFLDHSDAHTRATTSRSYEQVLRLHIVPYIGRCRLAELSPDRIKSMYEQLKSKVSASMLARVHVVLRAMLNLAVEERVITSSPLVSIRKAAPRHKRPRVEALQNSQVKTLRKAAKGHRLESLINLAVATGLRQGELFALRWSDVDLRRRKLSVVRSAQEIDGEITYVDPKTDSSRRRVTLSKIAVAAIEKRAKIADREGHRSELIFPTERGYVLRKSNFLRRVWQPVCLTAGLPHLKFHTLRHTWASLLLTENVHPKVVQEMGGWSSIRIVLDTYSHLIPTMQAQAANALDRALGYRTRARKKTV
jgi:integrase